MKDKLFHVPVRVLFCVACVVSLIPLASVRAGQAGDDLAVLFQRPESWRQAASAFVEDNSALHFRLPDPATAVSRDFDRLRFLGIPVREGRVHFEGESVRRVELSLYNKGDAGDLLEDSVFDAQVHRVRDAIRAATGEAGIQAQPTSPRPNYMVYRHQWTRGEPAMQVEWAFIRPHRSGGQNIAFSAEYISVLLVPNQAGARMGQASAAPTARRMQQTLSIRDNVRRNAHGDVWVDNIPMVDQGDKGYCAASTSERLLRYYGLDIDQHQIAQMADTAAEGGTSIEGMVQAMSAIGRNHQLDWRDVVSTGSGRGFERSAYGRQLQQYNTEAARRRVPVLDWKAYLQNHSVDLQRIWADMDPGILLAARVNQKMAYDRFLQDIKRYTEQGVPLVWSCLVGLYPETPPLGQTGAFGHVRLIIGFNEQTREVLFSDTWGAAHTLKRMPIDQAWAMTMALSVLSPRNVR